MNRLWLGVGLLVFFLAVSLWCGWAMGSLHTELAQQMDRASQSALSGDMEGAVADAEQVQRQWQKHWKPVAAITDHEPMEEIDGLFAQLAAYAQADRAYEFAACSARLARLLEAAGEAHTPMWWNLL